MGASKRANKERLAAYVKAETGLVIDPNTVFDVQVKRFHAYKRQLMNIMKVMDIYNRRIANPNFHVTPTTFIFSGKAASSYTFAKETIRLINSVAEVINNDARVNEVMKVCFIPNFRVSNAQLIYPAAEISEQISTAGKEASGTSNMKLMMNGAITLGTLDGANIEIADLAGRENEAIFGLTAPEVEQLWASNSYFAWDTLNNDRERLGRVMDELKDNTFAGLSGNFESIYNQLMNNNDPRPGHGRLPQLRGCVGEAHRQLRRPGDLEPQGSAQHRLERMVLERPHHSRVPRRDLARVKARELPYASTALLDGRDVTSRPLLMGLGTSMTEGEIDE